MNNPNSLAALTRCDSAPHRGGEPEPHPGGSADRTRRGRGHAQSDRPLLQEEGGRAGVLRSVCCYACMWGQ